MNKGAPDPLVGKVLSLVVSTCELGAGAPAVILRGFFFDYFIFNAPPPDSIVEKLSQTRRNLLYHSLHDYYFHD